MATWIPSPNITRGRARPLRLIVWHSMETDEYGTAAEDVARNWFSRTAARVSAHVTVDNNSVVECVKPGDTAWATPNANADGYQIELAGRANQTAAQWRDPYSQATIANACAWIKTQPALAHIPARWLTDDQLRSGAAGHTTHAQCSRVLRGGDHWDPGPTFPLDLVLSHLNPPKGPTVMPITDSEIARIADASAGQVLNYQVTRTGPDGRPTKTAAIQELADIKTLAMALDRKVNDLLARQAPATIDPAAVAAALIKQLGGQR